MRRYICIWIKCGLHGLEPFYECKSMCVCVFLEGIVCGWFKGEFKFNRKAREGKQLSRHTEFATTSGSTAGRFCASTRPGPRGVTQDCRKLKGSGDFHPTNHLGRVLGSSTGCAGQRWRRDGGEGVRRLLTSRVRVFKGYCLSKRSHPFYGFETSPSMTAGVW